jgi:hypothetical protein
MLVIQPQNVRWTAKLHTKKMWVEEAKNVHYIIVILMSTVLKTETSHNGNRSPNDCMESQPLICSAVITSDITLLMVLLQVHKLYMKWYIDLGDHWKYREVYPTDAALWSSLVHWWSAHVESCVNMKTARCKKGSVHFHEYPWVSPCNHSVVFAFVSNHGETIGKAHLLRIMWQEQLQHVCL